MIFASLLSIARSLLTNMLLYFTGKLVINNRRFLGYLGINVREAEAAEVNTKGTNATNTTFKSVSFASYKDNKIAIEDILILIGLMIQLIAIVSFITEFAVTLAGLWKLIEADKQNMPTFHNN